jgi:APA family basic amino acid/polyamine antiporter
MGLVLVLNILSTRYGGIIQVAATIGKLIPVIAILGFGLFSGMAPGASGLSSELIGSGSVSIAAAILGTLWAYDGWIGVTNMAGELKNPAKSLPKVISIGVIFATAVYALFNIALFKVLSFDEIVPYFASAER